MMHFWSWNLSGFAFSLALSRDEKERKVCFKFLCRKRRPSDSFLLPPRSMPSESSAVPPSLPFFSFLLLPSSSTSSTPLSPTQLSPRLCSQTCSCLSSSSHSSHSFFLPLFFFFQLSLLPTTTTKRQAFEAVPFYWWLPPLLSSPSSLFP